jgi:hypothetical protein
MAEITPTNQEKDEIKNVFRKIHQAEEGKKGENTLSVVQRRQLESHLSINFDRGGIEDAAFQHSVLCQTFLPYRDPGDEVRLWDSRQGKVRLLLKAGEALNPRSDQWEPVGLPYGARARLILAHINTQAVKSQSAVIDVENSLSAFILKLGLHREGKTIAMIKDQLFRLAASNINLAFEASPKQVVQTKFDIIKAFDLWFPKDDRQKVLWTSTIQLSDDYLKNLLEHAVPLDVRALAALKHNALAIDIYTWLAQRLHRIEKENFVSWQNLKEQFGAGYDRMDKFKSVFRDTLKKTLLQYPEARLEEIPNKGFNLRNSPPPILKGVVVMPGIEGGKKPDRT